jgi:hypothetical protein
MKPELLLELADSLSMEVYVELCDRVTKIDKHDIDGELKRQAAIYSYYAGTMVIVKQRVDALEIKIEQRSAQVRLAAVDNSDKKVTDKTDG